MTRRDRQREQGLIFNDWLCIECRPTHNDLYLFIDQHGVEFISGGFAFRQYKSRIGNKLKTHWLHATLAQQRHNTGNRDVNALVAALIKPPRDHPIKLPRLINRFASQSSKISYRDYALSARSQSAEFKCIENQ